MTIAALIHILNPLRVFGPVDGIAGGLRDDSRKVTSGDTFIAVKGTDVDGHDYIGKALENGASVIIASQDPSNESEITATWIVCKDTREVLAPLAMEFAENPQRKLTLIGVTGTNGKTTVTTLIWQVMMQLGYRAALLGTVSKQIADQTFASNLTTPGAIELANDMKLAVEAGCRYFIMEVSSHALDQGRAKGLDFEVAVFTNLTHDHLDYHKSLEQYATSKKLLFDGLGEHATAIVNIDDSYGSYMVSGTKATIWDLTLKSEDYYIHSVDKNGILVNLDGIYIESPLTGEFNAYNVSQAFLALVAAGVPAKDAARGLAEARGAAGRLERILVESESDLPSVFVDYAHTPNALENVLQTLNGIREPGQKIITVFGCGGNRDRTKRPVMAAVAERFSDDCIVTSDNPRFEDPQAIVDEVCTGFSADYPYVKEVDRKNAINRAILHAPNDAIILIAGKGHEPYQEIQGVRHHLDDREISSQALLDRARSHGMKGVH